MKEKIVNDWNIQQMYSGTFNFETMTNSLEVLNDLHEKHKSDESIVNAMDALREDICRLFGGSIYKQ